MRTVFARAFALGLAVAVSGSAIAQQSQQTEFFGVRFFAQLNANSRTSSSEPLSDQQKCASPHGDLDQNIAACDRIIGLYAPTDPNLSLIYQGRGYQYEKQNNFRKALEDYSEAIRINPKNAGALLSRGTRHLNLKSFQQAVDDLSKSIEADPSQRNAWYNRGIAHFNLKNNAFAIRDFQQALKIQPNDTDSKDYLKLLGVKHENNSDECLKLSGAVAIAACTRSIESKQFAGKTLADILLQRGILQMDLGNDELAVADYSEAIRVDPQFAEAFYNRGIAHNKLKRYQLSVDDYTSAIKLFEFASFYNNRGISNYDLGNYEAALRDFTDAIRLDPKHFNAYVGRSRVYGQVQKNYLRAIEDLDKAITIRPQLAQLYYLRGEFRNDLGQSAQAIEDFRQALRLDPNFKEAQRALATKGLRQ